MTIAIIDYGMGNLYSVAKAVEKVSAKDKVIISSDSKEIKSASRVIFPGQGSMPGCMAEIKRRELGETLLKVSRDRPFFGICVGLQLLFSHSEEGDQTGLGILSGKVSRLEANEQCKVPHMGWNNVAQQFAHPLWHDIANNSRFYFVHSYFVKTDNQQIVAAKSTHGQEFACAVIRDNIFAVQFHPEKSGQTGLQLIANFVKWLA